MLKPFNLVGRSKVFILTWLFFLELSRPCAAFEIPSVEISADTHKVDLGAYSGIYEDESGYRSFNDMVNIDRLGLFKPVKEGRLSGGYTESAYWLKIRLVKKKSEVIKDPLYWLEIANAQLTEIDFYSLQSERLAQIHTGADKPFHTRPINHRHYIFPIDFSEVDEQTVYFRIATQSTLEVPLTLWSRENFLQHDNLFTSLNAAYLGIILIMACYNFFLYCRIKDKSYLAYVIYVCSFGFLMVGLMGYGRQYMWPTIEGIDSQFIPIMCLFLLVTGGQFARIYLQTQDFTPQYDNVIKLIMGAAVIGIVLNVILPTGLRSYSVISVVLASTVILLVGWKRYQQGSRLAGFYILGWGMLIASTFIYLATNILNLFASDMSLQFLLTGSVIEMVLFSLGLADRINSERMAKHSAFALQRLASEYLEKANVKLHSQAKELEIALKSSDKHNRLKEEFLCSVSHELRTPINGIAGGLEILEKQSLTAEQKDVISTIEESSKALLGLVDTILDFNDDIQSLNEEAINIGDVIAHCVQLLLPRARSTKWLLDKKSTSFPAWLMGDKERLTQLVFHLLSNALKYGDKKVKIGLFCEEKDQGVDVRFEVWNDGESIPEDRQQTIFEPFTQGSGGYGRINGGLGIGLAVCKKMVELMGGNIEFETDRDRGTKFIVSIRLTRCAESSYRLLQDHSLFRMLAAKQNQLTAHFRSLSFKGDKLMKVSKPEVLVVEDNQVNRKILRKMLVNLGYRVTEACDGKDGFLRANQKEFAAILMDCQMPFMDGFITTENIRKLCNKGQSVPIIAITANILEVDRKKCLLAGMNDYLMKPAKMDDIKECLSRWVSPHSS